MPVPMISKKSINKFLKGAIAVAPAIPYITSRKKSSMLGSFIVGGLGVAVLGGIAAVMFFSPRTRYRALDVAKNTYGKVNDRITHLRGQGADGSTVGQQPLANGLVSEHTSGYSTTGL